MKYIILVLWTFSLFLLMFSSFPFRVECRPNHRSQTMGPRPHSAPLILLPSSSSSSNIYFNNHHQQSQHLIPSTSTSTTACPVMEGPSATRFNPWPDLYIPDITAKVWESPIVLEGTARSRSEVRPDGTFGVTFDLHRVVKGDAPLLRRRRQFRLQFLDNPNPSPDPREHRDRDRDFLGGSQQGRKNPNKNISKISNSSLISSSTKSSRSGSSINNNNNSRNNNNFNNVYNSHSNPRSGSSSSSSSSLSTKQLHPPTSSSSSQSHQIQLYQQQQSIQQQRQRQLQLLTQQQQQRQLLTQPQQSQQFRQSQSLRPVSTLPPRGFRNSSLPSPSWGSSSGSTNFQGRPPTSPVNNGNRALGSSVVTGRRSGRNSRSMRQDQQPPSSSSSPGNKCVPPKATVKTGRKYYVFAAKVENHFIAVFSPELSNKRNIKAVEGILCKGCGQAPSVVAAQKDVQLNVKERIRLRCRLRAGNPIPLLTWYKDGRSLVNLTDTRFRLRTKRRQSILVIRKAKEIDVGVYRCEAKNVFGSAYASVRVSLASPGSETTTPGSKPKSTIPKPNSNPLPRRPSKTAETTATTLWPLEARECPYDSYCLNGGTCSYFETIGEFVCQCTEGFKGQRCDTKDISSSSNSGGDYESTRRLLNLWD